MRARSLAPAFLLLTLAAPARPPEIVRIAACHSPEEDADDSACIQRAIDRSPPGAVIDFSPGPFHLRRALNLKGSHTYIGPAAIRMDPHAAPGTPIGIVEASESHDLRIENLDLDGSGVGGILMLTINGSSAPAPNLVIRGNTFRNSNPAPWSDAQSALYIPVGADRCVISGNTFQHVGTGMALANLNRCEIRGNTFDGVLRGNAISVLFSNAPFPRGKNLIISGNTGRNLSRMAIEIFHGGGEPPSEIAIEENRFSDWSPAAAHSNDAYGISLVAGSRHRVVNNVLSGPGPYGIEVGTPETLVSGNVVTGFGSGIVLQNARSSTISANRVLNSTLDGIVISNASTEPDIRILNNEIANAKRAGIGGSPTDYGGAVIAGNRILRAAGFYPDDSRVTFYGIQVQPGCTRPVQYRDNVILQTASDPPAGFNFYGFGLFGGHPGNYYGGNRVQSASRHPLGAAFFSQGVPFLDGNTVENHIFVSLARVTAGFRANAAISRNNSACNVAEPDPSVASAKSGPCPPLPQ